MAIPFIGDLIDGVKDIIGEVVVDKDKRNEINFKVQELADRADERIHQEILAQVEVNKIEASSGSLFVAGWRPAVGWVGAIGFGYSAILQPFMSWIARVVFEYGGTFPIVNDALLITTLGGMLGIGAMRSFEKWQGVSTNDFTDVPGRTQSTQAGKSMVEVNTKTGSVSVETNPASIAPILQTPVKKPKKKFKIF